MRRPWSLVLVFILTATTMSAAEAGGAREAIEEGDASFVDAFNNGDAAKVASFYAEDAALFPPGEQRVDGRQAIQAYWKGAMDAGLSDLSLQVVEVGSDGDLAYEVGRLSVDVPAEDGDAKTVEGKYVVVWKREAGGWRLYRDIWNMNPPPSDQ
jgi:uncharacterized protein (TIGR02246 family)